jgi:hypothetical protein
MTKHRSSLDYAEIQGLKLFLHWLNVQEKSIEVVHTISVVTKRLQDITN